MKNIILFNFLLILGACSMNNQNLSSCSKTKAPSIPLEEFFRNPEQSSFQLSPEGGFISYMKPWKDGNRMMNVYVKSIDKNNEIRITKASKRSLYGYFWLNDSRIAYIQDKGGDENIHIYAVDIDGENDIDLTPFDNIQARITDDLEDDNNFMLI